MSVLTKSNNFALGSDVGGVITKGVGGAGNFTAMRDIAANKDGNLSSYVSNYGSYSTSNLRLSSFFGEGGAGYTKHRAYVNTSLGKYGTNSLNGAILAGTNGDHEATVVGNDAYGNWYYVAGFQSHAWRPGANLYRINASGHVTPNTGYGVSRVYSYHHLADMIQDQSTTVVPLDNIWSRSGSGHFAIATRYQNTGRPIYLTTRWAGSYDGVTNTGSIYGANNLALNQIFGVSEWGQVMDGINIPNSDARYTTGVVLWQRQWWGQRVIFNKRNGDIGILNTHVRHMDAFNGYQNWTNDHNSGNGSGITYSPATNRIYVAHVHGDCQSVCRSFSINHTVVSNQNGTGTISTSAAFLGLIHFIWGGWDSCRADWGHYTGCHITWLDNYGGRDKLAYAIMRERNSPYGYWPGNNGLWFRIVTANIANNNNNTKCSYPELYEQFVTGDVNYYQRIRVRRMGVQRVHNSSNTLTATYHWVALSWVDGSQRTRIRIWRVNFATNGVQQMADITQNTAYRGTIAFQGTPVDYGFEPQHLFVLGTANTGLQNTYVWAGGKPYNPGYDQDQSVMVRFL